MHWFTWTQRTIRNPRGHWHTGSTGVPSTYCKAVFWQLKQSLREWKWLISSSEKLTSAGDDADWRLLPVDPREHLFWQHCPWANKALWWGLLMSLWHSPCSTHPLSTSWYKQIWGSLNKAPSFTPKPICTTTACQCHTGIQTLGNGLTPKRKMLSARRPEEELGRKRSIAGQDWRVWPHFLMGGSQEWEKEAVFLSGQPQD